MLKTLFKPSPEKFAGRALYTAISAAARRPAFYVEAGVPDSPEGRFELYLIHLVLVVHRLKGEGAQASAVSQAMFDAFLRGLDDGLREMGVGDLSVGKKMRKLGEVIYGRMKAYDEALAMPDPRGELEPLVTRTLFADADGSGAAAVAAYVAEASAALDLQPLASLVTGEVSFPAFGVAAVAA
ncbi:ubiquinol-cytochrome C chaperone family protein [soil metagenome]